MKWLAVAPLAYVLFSLWLVFGRGEFGFVHSPVVAWFLRKIRMAAITIGARAYVAKPEYLQVAATGGTLWKHEKQHNRQWRVRPFFAPVYLYWQLKEGYERNPLEEEARNAESE